MDGVNSAGAYFATMSDCSDVETTESDKPFLYLFRNYFKNSYGHGRYRGGAGIGFGLKMHHVPWVGMGSFGLGSKFPSTMGIFGGYAVPPVFIQTVQQSNMNALLAESTTALPTTIDQLYEQGTPETGKQEFHSVTMTVRPLLNGETFYVPVGGGAGYGDALEREPERVITDLRNGLVTHWAAHNIYKVVYDEKTMRLDPAATAALRDETRAERRKRGKPYAEFEKDWLSRRPPEEVIRYYGSYPHPKEGMMAPNDSKGN
jgi:N-methylhydantoinase B/oxoprolinase/acetone carboxylase alpha subunit